MQITVDKAKAKMSEGENVRKDEDWKLEGRTIRYLSVWNSFLSHNSEGTDSIITYLITLIKANTCRSTETSFITFISGSPF